MFAPRCSPFLVSSSIPAIAAQGVVLRGRRVLGSTLHPVGNHHRVRLLTPTLSAARIPPTLRGSLKMTPTPTLPPGRRPRGLSRTNRELSRESQTSMAPSPRPPIPCGWPRVEGECHPCEHACSRTSGFSQTLGSVAPAAVVDLKKDLSHYSVPIALMDRGQEGVATWQLLR